MEILILFLVVYGLRAAVKDSAAHFGKSKAASRSASAGSSRPRRAASAVHHDVGYWASQIIHGFPEARHGFARGWHDERQRQEQARIGARKAKADRLENRMRLIPEDREHQRRIDEAEDVLRREREPEPESVHAKADEEAQPVDGEPGAGQPNGREEPQEGSADEGEGSPDGTFPAPETAPSPSPTEGSNGMPASQQADTTYTEHRDELVKIRADAEEEVGSVRRKRMLNRLDILTGLGLDKDSLSEAAAIDDALRDQQKAAQQTLDSTDAAIHGLEHRHGGIQEAVDNSPVAEPAQPGFYAR
jgi:hypothetical protein